MSEQHNKEPKKYYEYYYTWGMAEAMRKKHRKNGRDVCMEPFFVKPDGLKKWVIWYYRQKDTRTIPTTYARYYDK